MKQKKQGMYGWLFNRYFLLVILFNLSCSVMMQMFNSTISLHIDAMGMQSVIAGTVTSVGAITAFIYRVFGGVLSERTGRRILIAIGFPLFGIASMLLGLADTLPLILLWRVFQMLGYALVSTTTTVAVVDIAPKEHMGEAIGYFGLAISLSQAIGPSIALALFDTALEFRADMLVVLIAGLVACVLAVIFFGYEKDASFYGNRLNVVKAEKAEKKEKKDPAYRGIWTVIEKKALPAAAVNVFLTFSTALVSMFLTLYARKTGIASAGLFFTCSAIAMVLARLIAGRLADRYGTLVTVVPGTILFSLAFVLLIISGKVHFLYYVAGIFYGFGSGAASPALNAEAVRGVSAERRSVASSTFMLPFDVGYMVASVVWGALIDAMSFQVVFIIAAALVLIALILSVVFFRNSKRKVE